MNDHPIVPCLWFDDEAERAAEFYLRTFAEGRLAGDARYPESADAPSGKPRGSVMTRVFDIAGQRFTALNGGPMFKINPSVSFFVRLDTVEAAARLYTRLAEGGAPLMPFGAYPWSEGYGWIADAFGVSWQVIAGRRPEGGATIVPCLMFTGAQHGKALEAMETWARIFPGGRIDSVERYSAGEGPEATVKHGQFVLAGQELIAMDAHGDHRFTFNEGLSLQVACADQAEVDHYWAALSEGGAPGPCGWLKDRYGLSWQIVPNGLSAWMGSTDTVARDRAFAAMMTMTKPDIAALDAAFKGE